MVGAFSMEPQPTALPNQAGQAEVESEPPLYRTDEFRIFCMKVLPCSKRYCHDWTTCPFSHPNEKARRRDPRLFNYTGIACPDMKKDNTCVRGDQCPYAHNVFEYWLHPTRYRTQLCNDGVGCRRRVCFFAHTLQELRVPSSKPFVNPETLAAVTASAAAAEATRKDQTGLQMRAGSTGCNDLAALTAHLASMQCGGGPAGSGAGRHSSLPAHSTNSGAAPGSEETAVVQLLRALLRQQLGAESAGVATIPGVPDVNSHALRNQAAYASVAGQMPSSAELASLYASLQDGQAPAAEDPQDKAWQNQRLASIEEPVWESPRGSLDLSGELGDGGVRGGDSRLSSMPAYTLDYAGNIRAASQQFHADTLAGGLSRMDYVARHSADISRQGSTFNRLSFEESAVRRVSADEGRSPNFDMGAGMRNAAYHQVYNQAYEQSQQQQQQQQQQASQLYKCSSLYAPSSLGFPVQSSNDVINQEISTSPPRNPFNPDAFGESLMFNGAHFAPHSCGGFAASEGLDATFMRSHSNPPIQRMPRSAGLEPLTSSVAFAPNDYASAGLREDSSYRQFSLPALQQGATLFPPSTHAEQEAAGAEEARWRF